MGPGGQEHRRTQRRVHMDMDADSSKRVCAGCGEAMPAAEGWHKCSKCKAPVHSHITRSKVHSDPCDEESHICDSCFVGSKEQPGSPTSASSPGKVAAAGVLLSLAAAASGEDAARKSKEEMDVTVTSMMEKVKNHSVTVPLATLGKRMIADYLHDKGQEDAKKWFERHHQHPASVPSLLSGSPHGQRSQCLDPPPVLHIWTGPLPDRMHLRPISNFH